MAEVKWQARRIIDGVLVDVTGDTDGTPAGAPTPNALEGGAGGVPDPTGAPDGQVLGTFGEEYALGPHAVEVDNGVDPVTLIELINAPGATIDGTVATLATPAAGMVDGVLLSTAVTSDPPPPGVGTFTSGWSVDPDTGDVTINAAETTVVLRVDGSIAIVDGIVPIITRAADGTIVLSAAGGNNTLTLAADGSWELNGDAHLAGTPDGLKALGLATADPVVAGVLWNDAGVLKVSAG